MSFQKLSPREFPGSSVVMTWCFHCQGPASIPDRGTEILQDSWSGQKQTKFTNQLLGKFLNLSKSDCVLRIIFFSLARHHAGSILTRDERRPYLLQWKYRVSTTGPKRKS